MPFKIKLRSGHPAVPSTVPEDAASEMHPMPSGSGADLQWMSGPLPGAGLLRDPASMCTVGPEGNEGHVGRQSLPLATRAGTQVCCCKLCSLKELTTRRQAMLDGSI